MSARKLRIAFVDYVLEPNKPGRSGLSDIVWDMASELISQGHDSHVIASYATNEYPDPRVIVHDFPTPLIGYRNVIGHLWILKRAFVIAKQLRPDIIQAPEYVSTAVFAALGARSPLVLTVPGNVFHRVRHGHSYEWYYLQVLKWAARASARHCAAVIATSQEMKAWWERTGSDPNFTPLIPLGVNPKRFFPVSEAKDRLGITRDTLFLLYVGRFSEEKGLLDLVDALARNKALFNLTHVQVMLIGKGKQGKEIHERICMEGLNDIVHVKDWLAQDELKLWYSAADALIMPSWNEPFGKVMIEAMACSTPVIATEVEGPLDHIRVGQNGFLFPPRDSSALANVLSQVIQNPDRLRNMRSATLKYAQNHLTWEIIVKKIIEDVYLPITITKGSQEHVSL